jgi:predicted HicB family RNase H-like nuclease
MTRKNNPEPIRYTDQISFRVPPPMVSAIATAASARMQSMNSWLRAAALEKLSRDGVPIEKSAA